ncbi:MAG: PilZ domain-containing protein [Gemmataceae bacterium]
MDSGEHLRQQADQLLIQVETLQRTVAQLYVALQRHREAVAQHVRRATASATAGPKTEALASPPTTAPSVVDRRAAPRHSANQVVIELVSVMDDAKPFAGWVLDYSAGGLGLLVDKKIPIGTYLNLRPHQAPLKSKSREAEVKNCQPYLDGYRIGCQLEQELSADDLRFFGLTPRTSS